jgi:glucokinase
MVDEVAELQSLDLGEIIGVGIGIPGLLDRAGKVWQAPNLRRVEGATVGPELAKRTGLPVATDNDANLAAVAEFRLGNGRGHSDIVLLTVGTGVGGGLIVGGKELRGGNGMAAELGHIVVQAPDGRPCIGDCPNHGCLESVASGTALVREAHELADENPGSAFAAEKAAGTLDGPRVTELAQAGDLLAIETLRRIGTWLGVGMSSLGNIFDPDVILVGGGASAAGELIVGPAREEFSRRAMRPIVANTQVLAAKFGGEAGILGAGLIAFDAADEAAASAPARAV